MAGLIHRITRLERYSNIGVLPDKVRFVVLHDLLAGVPIDELDLWPGERDVLEDMTAGLWPDDEAEPWVT